MEITPYPVTQSDRIGNLMRLSNYNESQTTPIPWSKIIVGATVVIVIGVLIYEHSNREKEDRKYLSY
jgi:hypothetical protein